MQKGKWVLLILCLAQSLVYAQTEIEGVIVSADGQAVIGATIVNTELNIQEVSDFNGEFALNIDFEPNHTFIINISSVGFQAKFVEIKDEETNNPIRITLAESVTNLPEVVVQSVTMTGGLAHVHKNIGSAHFIGQKEIQKFSYSDINRTLRNIPGVNMQEEDGYGLRPNIGLRASGSERSSKITVMEDGILAAPAPYAAPSAYYFPTIGRMEAVEIMKGSSQIKYGPFTTGGAINFISTPIPLKFGGHADLIGGNNGYRMLHANVGNSHQNVGYIVETFQYGASGFKDLDNDGDTGFSKSDYLAKLKFNTNPNAKYYQSLQFKIGRATETSNETYLGLTEEDFNATPYRRYAASAKDQMNTEQSQYVLTHHIELADFFNVVTNVYHNDFSRNWYKLDKVSGQKISNVLNDPTAYVNEYNLITGLADGSEALSVKANNRSYYGRGAQTHLIFHFNDKAITYKIDASLRIHEDQIDRFQWIDQYDIAKGVMSLAQRGVPGTESNRVETANALAAFVNYELKWDKLTLTPGIRYENIKSFREDYGKSDTERTGSDLSTRENKTSVFIPGVGMNYDWTGALSTFMGIHKGFAPPGSKEGTKPEESWNYELGLRIHDNAYRFQILGYYNDYSNLLGSDLAATGGQGTTDLINGGAAIAQGIEVEGSYDLLYQKSRLFKLPLSFAYTFTEATFEENFESEFDAWGTVSKGYSLPYTPRHQFSVSLGLEHAKFLFDISSRYNGSMLSEAGLFENESTSRVGSYLTTDVSLNYKINQQISAFANVNNVTNKVYVASLRPAGFRPGLPRSYNFGLKANF